MTVSTVSTSPDNSTPSPNQFALLAQRRFAPFFWTQFLGAGNDNLFKFAFTLMVTYQVQVSWLPTSLAGMVIGAVFIAPFLLFSATSGQLADKLDKSQLMRAVKTLEIGIMALASFGFFKASAPILLICVFLMGLHSTIFGPAKFAYLPQHLRDNELTGGNGMVEMGTFVSILLGNMAGGLLAAIPGTGLSWVAVSCLGLALLGRLTAQFVPPTPATDSGLRICWNPLSETWRNLSMVMQPAHRVVFQSMLGISWMWFFGAVFLSNFPAFAKDILQGDAHVASLLLVVFSVGVGAGSLACEILSRLPKLASRLTPMGALGMTLFSADLYFASKNLPPTPLQTISVFLQDPTHWRVLADLGLLAAAAGLYSVPLYTKMQVHTPITHRARIIAANNILNALFMIVSALWGGALITLGGTVLEVFLCVGCLNLIVAVALGLFWKKSAAPHLHERVL